MTSIVFLDAASLGSDTDLAELKAFGNIKIYANTSISNVAERLKDATIAITNKVPLNGEILAQLPALRLICVAATGIDHVNLEIAAQRGVIVKNVCAYSTESVAQHTFALTLSLLHHLPYYNKYVQSGHYCQSQLFTHLDRPFSQIQGKTWGIIGLGAIGKRTAELASAFDASVIYFSTSGKNADALYPRVELEFLLKNSDIVTIHAPLNRETKNLISHRQLGWMRPNAILINVGRGGIVDEGALKTALDEGQIAGAGCDVFSTEPPAVDNPLLNLRYPERFIATPHLAWGSTEARQILVAALVEHIRVFKTQN